MRSQIKQELLKLLETDQEIRDAIGRIVNAEVPETREDINENQYLARIASLETECEDLRKQRLLIEREFLNQKNLLQEKEDEIVRLKNEFEYTLQSKTNEFENILQDKTNEIVDMKSKLSKSDSDREKITEKYNSFYLRYGQFEEVFRKYSSLGDEVIARTARILNGEGEMSTSPIILFAYGMQENNIVALWETIATNYDFFAERAKLQDLIDILSFFLETYKEVSYKQIIIEWPNEGETFDERVHTRTASSSAVGNIKQVILPGMSIGKNISKKSLVIVE